MHFRPSDDPAFIFLYQVKHVLSPSLNFAAREFAIAEKRMIWTHNSMNLLVLHALQVRYLLVDAANFGLWFTVRPYRHFFWILDYFLMWSFGVRTLLNERCCYGSLWYKELSSSWPLSGWFNVLNKAFPTLFALFWCLVTRCVHSVRCSLFSRKSVPCYTAFLHSDQTINLYLLLLLLLFFKSLFTIFHEWDIMCMVEF